MPEVGQSYVGWGDALFIGCAPTELDKSLYLWIMFFNLYIRLDFGDISSPDLPTGPLNHTWVHRTTVSLIEACITPKVGSSASHLAVRILITFTLTCDPS